MIEFTTGDMFKTAADIRVNTVNCVGVMGAGVALAFKVKYPKMFIEYQKACKVGKIKPGHLNFWKDLISGETIINFPTKRHWREPSRYEDIEAGLIALRKYLSLQGNVRVVLPAIGCGHGGLEWERISGMIRNYLSNLQANIIVFNPLSSMEAEEKVGEQVDEASTERLNSQGVIILKPFDNHYPKALRGISAATLYLKGNLSIINNPLLAIIPSVKPTETEIRAANACLDAIVQQRITFILGYGPYIERPIIAKVLNKGCNVIILLSEGILNFRIRKDLEKIWDNDRIVVLSASKPTQRWTSFNASKARNIELILSKVALITDPNPQWISKLPTSNNKHLLASLFYINYHNTNEEIHRILYSANAKPINRDAKTGIPKVSSILDCLNISKESEYKINR